MEQAIRSAAKWNQQFNKTRKFRRKASMDLQSHTVHYPRKRLKRMDKSQAGNYPVAVLPGQFTDSYHQFTCDELKELPLGTVCGDGISNTGSDSSSGSDSSDSGSDSCTRSSTSGSSSDETSKPLPVNDPVDGKAPG
ncbi:PHD finger protein 10-like [Cylas formicarius]|uniref:PHD finger protein 10-like n=1 Tax=Cylas formicarius TaxID=197179 RepID=UPI00295841CB|nr:PHD finger protein 10-like [Cylas formicarius]